MSMDQHFTRKATWSISLDTVCPNCEMYNDLFKDENFDRLGIKMGEVQTTLSHDVWVVCPECGYEYYVDLEMGE